MGTYPRAPPRTPQNHRRRVVRNTFFDALMTWRPAAQAGTFRIQLSRATHDQSAAVRDGARRVAIEILARAAHEQLLIREMVEDSPSVDAQTAHKRILHKEGLLFVVRVGGGGVSPELLSRASIVLE